MLPHVGTELQHASNHELQRASTWSKAGQIQLRGSLIIRRKPSHVPCRDKRVAIPYLRFAESCELVFELATRIAATISCPPFSVRVAADAPRRLQKFKAKSPVFTDSTDSA